MKININEIPVAMELGGNIMRTVKGFGDMDVNYHEFKAGTDFTPILKGLKDDLCPCPHYGYIVEGAFRFIYKDGSEEVFETGDVYYAPAGHTAIVEKDTKLIDFSPIHEHQELLAHVEKVVASM
ncbi:MAG: hypothetical protein AB3N63_06515 [Puniceicoccaceae bacterium]